MYRIKLMNKIAQAGTGRFDQANYEVSPDVENADAIMVRSAALHDLEFEPALRAIARCGAGVNNIPLDRCADAGIVVFNTPGANANGVKELAVAALLLSSRDILGGVAWARTLTEDVAKSVEAGKSKFAGCEILGKTLGVIGLGAVGGLVANAGVALGMKVIGCDPFLTPEAEKALSSGVQKVGTYEEIYEKSDYVSVHVPLTPETKNFINADTISRMKRGVRIINLSRADLANAADLKAALADGQIACYVVDFPTEETVNVPGIIAIPHLGASTEESEENCAAMAADEIMAFLEKGDLCHSVNYPSVSMPRTGVERLVILHRDNPDLPSKLNAALADANISVSGLASRSKGGYASTLIDTATRIPPVLGETIKKMDGVIRLFVIE